MRLPFVRYPTLACTVRRYTVLWSLIAIISLARSSQVSGSPIPASSITQQQEHHHHDLVQSAAAKVNWDATGVIVPLYSWPLEPDSWDPVYSAIATHPTIPFYVVLNPSAGPGSENGPGAEYIEAVQKLKNQSNVELLGYVGTHYGLRSQIDVRKDIKIYSSWSKDFSVDGIFFDEVQDDAIGLYYGYTNFAMMLYNEDATIILNTGKTPVEQYYELADQIVTFEDEFSQFSDEGISDDYAYQQSVIVHSFPKGDFETARAVVARLKHRGLGSIYITDLNTDDEDVYNGFGSLLDALASSVADSA